MLVPIDTLAKEFKGNATFDSQKNEVHVTLPDATNLAHQVSQFENAFHSSTAKEALDTWVRGIKTRNGALQYAVFSPELREKTKKEFDENFWVTGGSSPKMDAIEKLEMKQLSATTIQYSFDYTLVASNYQGRGNGPKRSNRSW